MQDRIARQRAAQAVQAMRGAHAARLAMFALCTLLGGCSSFTLESPLLITDPGKFQYHSCDQLNAAAKATSIRVQDLKVLMAKADQGIAGPLVGAVAYRIDYIAANGDLRLIDETARAKNCVTPSTWQSNSVIQ
jgi:hypothetical protein